jgi:hypothetical protein
MCQAKLPKCPSQHKNLGREGISNRHTIAAESFSRGLYKDTPIFLLSSLLNIFFDCFYLASLHVHVIVQLHA